MPSTEIEDVLLHLTKGIVLADVSQTEQLRDLSHKLVEFARLTKQGNGSQLSDASQAGADLLKGIVDGDVKDPSAVLEAVERLITALQSVLIDGRPFTEVESWLETVEAGTNAAPDTLDTVGADQPDGRATDDQTAPVDESAPPTKAANDEPLVDLEPFSVNADPDLIAGFVTESQEHLDAVDTDLLTIEQDPSDKEALNAVFRAFHTIKGVAGFLELTAIQQLAHETETLLDRSRNGTLTLADEAIEVVFEATDAMKELVAGVAQVSGSDEQVFPPPSLPALLVRIRSVAEDDSADATLASPNPAIDIAEHTNAANAADAVTPEHTSTATSDPAPDDDDSSVERDRAEPQRNRGGAPQARKTAPAATNETIRVDAERLDKLVDIIGEMVIAEAMVSQAVDSDSQRSSPLSRMLNHLDKITRELQELAMSMRMVPVRSTFQRMARLARDVSKKLDKPLSFVLVGEDTELDKNVVDAIGDPLVHMVRNAVDHGIENSAEERRQAGKPETGRVELRAFHKGGNIHIEIEDDGQGLDRETLIAKAKDRGLVEDGDSLTDAEAYSLIFEPGFSTATQVTDVSGRGVGLDVVKRGIQALRGKTEIRSEKGKGTTFSIRLPLTLAIIEGMVIRLGNERLIVPTLSIVRMVRPDESDLSTVFGRGEMLKLGDSLVPLFRLNQLFRIDGTVRPAWESAVVVVEHDNQQVAFLADELLGQQQIVIKPLGEMFKHIAGFSGGAIMPDGRVGLILDVPGLAAIANETTESQCAA